MARLAGRLERFSREFDFVARRAMLVNGAKLNPGDPIDKSKFTTRRLRQLYEWRHICRVVCAPAFMGPSEQVLTQMEQAPKRRGRPPKTRAA
jgi:hypothetical protein